MIEPKWNWERERENANDIIMETMQSNLKIIIIHSSSEVRMDGLGCIN